MEIPKFYFPDGKPVPEDLRAQMQSKVEALMKRNPSGLAVPAIKELLTDVRLQQSYSEWKAEQQSCSQEMKL